MTNYLRFKKLTELYVPVTRPTLSAWIHQGKFPKPIQLNPGIANSPIVWREDEILAWLAAKPRGFGLPPQATIDAHQRAAAKRMGPLPRLRRTT